MAPTTRSNTGATPNKGNAGKRTATAAAPKKGSARGRTATAATTKKGAVEGSSMSTTTRFQLLIHPTTSTADVSASPRAEKNIYSCTAGRPRPLWYVQHQRPPMRTELFHSITSLYICARHCVILTLILQFLTSLIGQRPSTSSISLSLNFPPLSCLVVGRCTILIFQL
jgi:hypothetical protein